MLSEDGVLLDLLDRKGKKEKKSRGFQYVSWVFKKIFCWLDGV